MSPVSRLTAAMPSSPLKHSASLRFKCKVKTSLASTLRTSQHSPPPILEGSPHFDKTHFVWIFSPPLCRGDPSAAHRSPRQQRARRFHCTLLKRTREPTLPSAGWPRSLSLASARWTLNLGDVVWKTACCKNTVSGSLIINHRNSAPLSCSFWVFYLSACSSIGRGPANSPELHYTSSLHWVSLGSTRLPSCLSPSPQDVVFRFDRPRTALCTDHNTPCFRWLTEFEPT